MADRTTVASGDDVHAFLSTVEPEQRRTDAEALLGILERITGEPGVMWGSSIVGFGSAPYTTTKGTSPWMILGFSPRKAALTLYGLLGPDADARLSTLGPHTTGKGCLYLRSLDAVDVGALESIIAAAWQRKRPAV